MGGFLKTCLHSMKYNQIWQKFDNSWFNLPWIREWFQRPDPSLLLTIIIHSGVQMVKKDRLDEFLFGICIVKTILCNASLIKENNFSFKDLFLTKRWQVDFFYLVATKQNLFQVGPDFYIMTKRFRVSSPNMIFGILEKIVLFERVSMLWGITKEIFCWYAEICNYF